MRLSVLLTYKSLIASKDIPSIVVERESSPSPIVTPTYDGSVYGSTPGSPTPADRRFNTPDVSLALDMTAKLQRSSRRISDISTFSTDLGYNLQ